MKIFEPAEAIWAELAVDLNAEFKRDDYNNFMSINLEIDKWEINVENKRHRHGGSNTYITAKFYNKIGFRFKILRNSLLNVPYRVLFNKRKLFIDKAYR